MSPTMNSTTVGCKPIGSEERGDIGDGEYSCCNTSRDENNCIIIA